MRHPVIGVVAKVDDQECAQETPPAPRWQIEEPKPRFHTDVEDCEQRGVNEIRAETENPAAHIADGNVQGVGLPGATQIERFSSYQYEECRNNETANLHDRLLHENVAVMDFPIEASCDSFSSVPSLEVLHLLFENAAVHHHLDSGSTGTL